MSGYNKILVNYGISGAIVLCFAISNVKPTSEPLYYDGCPIRSAKLNDDCYWFSTQRMQVPTAQAECEGMGGNLALIYEDPVFDLITRMSYYKIIDYYWIGLARQSDNITWAYFDNNKTVINLADDREWSVSEPVDNSCAAMWAAGSLAWVAINCDITAFFICQQPIQNKTCAEDYSNFEDKCYKVIEIHMDWMGSSNHCRSVESGELAAPSSTTKHNFLKSLIKKSWVWVNTTTLPSVITRSYPNIFNKMVVHYIGFYKKGNKFRTFETGNEVVIPAYMWQEGEPNNLDGENCVTLWEQFNDIVCTNYFKFVCKIPVRPILAYNRIHNLMDRRPNGIFLSYKNLIVLAAEVAIIHIFLIIVIIILCHQCRKLKRRGSMTDAPHNVELCSHRLPMPVPRIINLIKIQDNKMASSINDGYVDIEPHGRAGVRKSNDYSPDLSTQRPVMRRLPSVPNEYTPEEIYDEIKYIGPDERNQALSEEPENNQNEI